ncbi:hypothetical protein SCUCBS95973_001437 [Sporothrix curviconia]|uniref:Histone demethylase JARID1 n=1 Tax=Sporothrix curviconia TaxID=1260050 RepID=A0ABP0AZ55_9PEZI
MSGGSGGSNGGGGKDGGRNNGNGNSSGNGASGGSGKSGNAKILFKSSSRNAASSSNAHSATSSRASPAVLAPAPQPSNTSSIPTRTRMGGLSNAGGGSGNSGGGPLPPLSAMLSAPLDLNSVERRGQPTASRETGPRKDRPHQLEEAPTYTPTEEEWKDPMAFMRKIAPEASEYGICKIIPPDSWNPPFAIDTQRFHFQTRKQELNSVEGSTRVNLGYLEGLFKYHKNMGNTLTRLPYVDKKPLDLYQLKKAVDSRGGFDMVCRLKKWAEIGRDLGYSGKIMSSLSTSLKNSYQKWLCPYEDYLRLAKPGVHQQLEMENGGPFTPSPNASPMQRSNVNTPSSVPGAASPARNASDALQASVAGSGRNTPATANNTPPPGEPDKGAVGSGSSLGLGPAHPLKRQLAPGDTDVSAKEESSAEGEEDGNSSRRSKRLKKEAVPRVAGSYMSLLRPQQPRIPRDDKSDPRESCEHCGKTENAGFLMVCESCDHAYHGKCVDPPIATKPAGEWNCPRCLVGDNQYGFEDGGLYSLKQFQEKAIEFKQSYFEDKMPFDSTLNCHRPITEDDVEREFWRLVSSIDDTVEVEYGADIHCTTHGSGFPTIEKNPNEPYSTDPWNLNILPLHPESLFRYIKSDISGMTVPWVYVGMTFSTFCWHNEDHYAYSANYQHFGDTKTWYGIPGADAEKFENAMREAVPDLFETQPDLLFQLVTLLPPEKLKEAGVRVYAVDQRAGQMVITFPQAYHAGFNHGFNFNEAVNFAPHDWEPFGLAGVDRLQQFRRQPCFSHEELLCTAADDVISAATGPLTIQTAKWLAPALERIRNREETNRNGFLAKHYEVPHNCPRVGGQETGPVARRHGDSSSGQSCPLDIVINEADVPEEEYQCSFCKAFTYLSRFKCVKTGKVLCLQHAGFNHCCTAREAGRFLGESHFVVYRRTSEDIETMCKKIAEKAAQPEAWEEKYDKILDEDATPSLKTLRAILNEGERIPYDLPSLPVLREFVDRCNHWVEEATTYIVRKQQNRRKAEARKSISAASSGEAAASGSNAAAAAAATASTADDKEREERERERETRNISNIYRLLDEATQIGFECPEIQLLQQRADAIKIFQEDAKRALAHVSTQTVDTIENLLDEGHSFNVDVPEVESLTRFLDQLKWGQKAEASRIEYMVLEDVLKLLEEGHRLGMPPYNDHMMFLDGQAGAGQQWEKKAKELLHADAVHYPQLEALSNQATSGSIPVTSVTLAAIDQILHKHRDAHRQVMDLNSRCHDPEYKNRPKYSEVVALMTKIEELQSKPSGTHDLEREQKRSEDWIRKGKRVFGKTNAPLYILKSHLEYVLDRNNDCFDTQDDKPRTPAEPASREPSPDEEEEKEVVSSSKNAKQQREVFCICRRTEAGMMIECEVCHEWYHGKCLKIARGKVKEDDKYTCPICDWRVKIPRDAARPDIESLISLYNEIPSLPFQPDEEQILNDIIQGALDFRAKVEDYLDPNLTSESDAIKQRFYLRKIEGAEILLTRETNFFRQVLHKRFPVAPDPPPLIEESKSTRKPRPTKLQKMMAQYQVDDPDDLPELVKLRANSSRRKMLTAGTAAEAAAASFRSSGLMVPLAPATASTQDGAAAAAAAGPLSTGSGGGSSSAPRHGSPHQQQRGEMPSPGLPASSADPGGFRRSSTGSYGGSTIKVDGPASQQPASQQPPRLPLDRHSTVLSFDSKSPSSGGSSEAAARPSSVGAPGPHSAGVGGGSSSSSSSWAPPARGLFGAKNSSVGRDAGENRRHTSHGSEGGADRMDIDSGAGIRKSEGR